MINHVVHHTECCTDALQPLKQKSSVQDETLSSFHSIHLCIGPGY